MTKQSELKQSTAPGPLARHMRAVATAETDDFGVLLKSSGLDPAKHLRFANWSGVDFSNSDLRGFDFTGSRLIGCSFAGALIEGARFDQAEIDCAGAFGSLADPARTDLRVARDWAAYLEGWSLPDEISADDHLPCGAVFQDAPFAPQMVVVPPGRFSMGSPLTEHGRKAAGELDPEFQHEVTIGSRFAVGRFPVTLGEFFVSLSRGRRAHTSRQNANRPVVEVTWNMATDYVAWLAKETAKPYRLLSEAEWEYCCRARTTTAYSTGNRIARDQACYDAKTLDGVGMYAGNAWGLHDFHGGVWEWCQDDWHETYEGAPSDGSAWTTRKGSRRKVTRGGSWQSQPEDTRSAVRYASQVDTRNEIIGFRVARNLVD